MRSHVPARLAIGLSFGFAVVSALSSGGCVQTMSDGGGTVIGLSEFEATDRDASSSADGTSIESSGDSSTILSGASGSASPVSTDGAGSRNADTPTEPRVIDSLVGQINGRPVFADAFFAPIEDEIVALRQSLTGRAWVERVTMLIQRELDRVTTSALFLSEAESALSSEQRRGLLYWMRDQQQKLTAQSGGNASKVRRQLEREEDKTLEEVIRAQRDDALINDLISRQIMPRVIVSHRDIEREYQRRFDEFNPDPTSQVATILVSAAKTESVAAVEAAIAEGKSFDDIRTENADVIDGGTQVYAAAPENLASMEFGGAADAIRAVIGDLREVGDIAGPVDARAFKLWLQLDAVDRGEPKTLFDVYQQLELEIRGARFETEYVEFRNNLFDEGIRREIAVMQERLARIALDRYGSVR